MLRRQVYRFLSSVSTSRALIASLSIRAAYSQRAAFFVYALGSALPVFTLSLVKDPAVAGKANSNAQDYSIVMIAKYAGNLIGLPLMTIVWATGIGIGGAWLGSPYFLSAVSFFPLSSFVHDLTIM